MLCLCSREIVLTQGHDKSADYWAYGCLLYELMCKQTPFEGRNQQRTFEKIVHSQKYLTFPGGFDVHCKSLIRRLLHPNAALRLGALQNGVEDIRTHAFFAIQNIDFDKLLAQEIPMEYVPLPPPDSAAFVPSGEDAEGFNLEIERTAIVDSSFEEFFGNLHRLDASIDGVDVMDV